MADSKCKIGLPARLLFSRQAQLAVASAAAAALAAALLQPVQLHL